MPSPTQAKAAELHRRLTEHAKRWPQITGVTVRYRAEFAYIDAVLEDGDELHLCRLRDTGHPEMWGFALFTYSSERYEDNILPTGSPSSDHDQRIATCGRAKSISRCCRGWGA